MNNTSSINNTDEWIRNELIQCRKMHYKLSRRLGRLSHSEEPIICKSSKGRLYYSKVAEVEGERKFIYLGGEDNTEVREIKEMRFLRKALYELECRIKWLTGSSDIMKPLDYNTVNGSLPKAYRLQAEHLKDIIGPDDEERWYRDALMEKKSFEKKYPPRYTSGRVHRAKDGTLMCSKSEVTIANELINRGIPYIYEMPVKVNNIWMHPDFSFYSYSRRRPMMWEHIGMLGDEGYEAGFTRKTDTYIRGGLVPCVDIIFTFDTTEGSIDTRLADAIIDEYR